MLENLIYNDDAESGFMDKVRNGQFDKDEFCSVIKPKIAELIQTIKEDDKIENSDIADLCNLFYDITSYSEYNKEVFEAEQELSSLIESLY